MLKTDLKATELYVKVLKQCGKKYQVKTENLTVLRDFQLNLLIFQRIAPRRKFFVF